MINGKLIAGVDVGSSSIKYSIYDSKTSEIIETGRARYPNETFQVNNVNIELLIRTFRKVLRLLYNSGIDSIGLSCMAPIMILVDSNNEVISSIPYNSLLGSEFLTSLDREEVYERTFNIPNVQMFFQKIMWLKSNNPRIMDRAKWIMDLNGLLFMIFSNWTEQPVQDLNTALEWGLYDISKGTWNFKIAKDLGIDKKLPGLVSPEYSITYDGVTFSIGTVDTIVSALGSVGMDQSKMFLSNGSTLCAGYVSNTPARTGTMYNDLFFEGKYLVNGCNSQYSTIIDWAEKNFRTRVNINEIDMIPRKVLFLPYLEGERCPIFDTNIRGALLDLDKSSTREDLLASVVHSLSYLSIDMIEELKQISGRTFNSITAGGGLSKRNLAGIVASLTSLNYDITNIEPATVGAILISMKGQGLIKKYPKDTEKYGLKIESRIYPDSSYLSHRNNFEKFRKFRDSLIAIYSEKN